MHNCLYVLHFVCMSVFISHNVFMCELSAVLCTLKQWWGCLNLILTHMRKYVENFFTNLNWHLFLWMKIGICSKTNTAMCNPKPDAPENLLMCCKHVGAKGELTDHDWSLYLRSITRVCMERLNSVEILGGYSQSPATFICFSSACNKYLDLWKYFDFSAMYIVFRL